MTNFRPADVPFIRAQTVAMVHQVGTDGYLYAIQVGEQDLKPDLPTPDAQAQHLAQQEVARLEASELFFVNADMVELARAAGATMPSFGLVPEDLPSRSGLVVFEEPLDVYQDPAGRPGDLRVVAACWGPCVGTEQPSLWITWYTDLQSLFDSQGVDTRAPWPLATHLESLLSLDGSEPIFVGEGGARLDASAISEHSEGMWRATLKACWVLMGQTLSSVTDAHIDRATHRRMKRANITPARVRIITLRRARAVTEERGESSREYHHRWIQRGHWRQQPCGPGSRSRKPTWIAPQLKGPEGAPLLGGEKVHVLKR
jgi:hypothetical protein